MPDQIDLHRRLWAMPARAVQEMYSYSDPLMAEPALWEYVKAVPELDDKYDGYDPYPDLRTVLRAAILGDYEATQRLVSERYRQTIGSAGRKVALSESAIFPKPDSCCSPEGLLWCIIIVASGKLEVEYVCLWHTLPLMLRYVLRAPVNLPLLRVLKELMELYACGCDWFSWFEAVILDHCIKDRLGDRVDIDALLAMRNRHAHDLPALLQHPLGHAPDVLAQDHENLLNAFIDESARNSIIEYVLEIRRQAEIYVKTHASCTTTRPEGNEHETE